MAEAPAPDRRILRSAVFRIVLGAIGVVGVAALIVHAGPHVVGSALRAAAAWMPVALALEAARIVTDILATRSAFGPRAASVPMHVLVRTHLIGYAVGALAPAGRTAAEATKAALHAKWVGAPAATAAAATNQAVTLLAVSVASIPCAIAAWWITGPSTLSVALIAHALALAVAGTALRGGMRAGLPVGWFRGRFKRFARHATAFRAAARETSLVPTGTLAAMVAGRVLQVAQFALLAFAIGIDMSVARALLAQGVNLVVMAVGVFVPGQIGAAEGAFAMSATALGTTVAKAMVIALLLHVVQLAWVFIGSITPMLWRATTRLQASGFGLQGGTTSR